MTKEQRENLYLSLIDAINEDNDEKIKKALTNFMNSSANEIRLALNSVGINDISEPMLIANLETIANLMRARNPEAAEIADSIKTMYTALCFEV